MQRMTVTRTCLRERGCVPNPAGRRQQRSMPRFSTRMSRWRCGRGTRRSRNQRDGAPQPAGWRRCRPSNQDGASRRATCRARGRCARNTARRSGSEAQRNQDSRSDNDQHDLLPRQMPDDVTELARLAHADSPVSTSSRSTPTSSATRRRMTSFSSISQPGSPCSSS